MEHIAHGDPALGQLGAGLFDVVDRDDEAFNRARCGGCDAFAEVDRAGGSGRRHLHGPESGSGQVGVLSAGQACPVEMLGLVDVGHGKYYDLELQIHHLLLHSSGLLSQP